MRASRGALLGLGSRKTARKSRRSQLRFGCCVTGLVTSRGRRWRHRSAGPTRQREGEGVPSVGQRKKRGGGPRAWPGPVGPLRVGPGKRKPGGGGLGLGRLCHQAESRWLSFFSFFFFYLFHFPNPFSKRVLGKTIKDITETTIHKNTMLQHEYKTCF